MITDPGHDWTQAALQPPAGPSAEAPAPELIEAGFALEIADAPLLHRGMNLADIAHVLVHLERGIIPPEPARRLLGVLLEVERTGTEAFPYDAQYGDAYNCRERYFVERLGDDAGWLHAGRPRREAGRVAFRLLLRRLTAELVAGAADLAASIGDLAERHAETIMPDQTYLQQAQPSTFGHYVLAFAYPTIRDAERLLRELDWTNRSPGGAGCVNGSRLTLDRTRISHLLGFDQVIEHTRDAMWQTDGLIHLLADSASLITTQSKLADDLEIWDSQEFDFVDLAGPYTRASMLMPQKRNPYALAIVRGQAGVLIGRLSGFLAVVKTPSARTDNLIFAYGEVSRSLIAAHRVTRLMTGVMSTLSVNPERMWEALLSGFSQATDLAELVMQACTVDYRTAYRIVGQAVKTASQKGLRGIDIDGAMLDEAAREVVGRPIGLGGVDLGEALEPRRIVMSRVMPGGAAPEVAREMASTVRTQAATICSEANRRLRAFETVESELLNRAEEASRER